MKNRDCTYPLERTEIAFYVSSMKNIGWSDLQLFLSVARGGGLSPAAL